MQNDGPKCRICAGDVDGYPNDHPERAICVACCAAGAEHHDGETGHVWSYDRWERDSVCDHCGEFARNTDYYDQQEYD